MAYLPTMLPPDDDYILRRMDGIERQIRELGPSVAESFRPVIADLTAKQVAIEATQAEQAAQAVTLAATVSDLADAQAAIEAQVTFLSGQSFGYTSTKVWNLATGTSGTGDWELLAYDSTYDDEYAFQASSTGVLKIEISAEVLLNNGSTTAWGATSCGYSLSWSGGSLDWSAQRSARVYGVNCGLIRIGTSATDVVTVPSNAMVTMRTRRARLSPIAPDTTWHGTRDTTVVVTRVGI